MKKVRIVAVQYKPVYLNITSNLKKFERIIKKNLFLKPDLFVFPEYALTGPLYSNYHLAFRENDKVFKKLSLLAKRYKINLIPGSFIRKIGARKFNSSCFINEKGRILGFYDKQRLWGSERTFLATGEKSRVFRSKIGNIAIQICADLHLPHISAQYFSLNPQIIINLAFWSIEDKANNRIKIPERMEYLLPEDLSKARALENRCYFVFCNFGSKLEIKAKRGRVFPATSIGNTMIVNPFGEIIAKTTDNKEGVISSEIDLNKCNWRKY